MPSDSELQSRFFRDEADFSKLVQMSDKDPHVVAISFNLTYLDTDMSWPRKNIGFSNERWNEYRRVFRKLHIEGGLTRRTDYTSSVFIRIYTAGGVLGSSEKGYAYSEKPLTPVVQSPDMFPRDFYNKNKGHAIVFEPLTANWYMYREEF